MHAYEAMVLSANKIISTRPVQWGEKEKKGCKIEKDTKPKPKKELKI